MNRRIARIVALVALALGVTACSYPTPAPDQVGLYYNEGSSDGYQFAYCIDGGKSNSEQEWNNSVVYLPTSVRTWNVATDESADSREPIVVATKPREGQPSGVPVSVWPQANMELNSNCDDIEGVKGGTLRKFWESIGRRKQADTDPGWKAMMLVTVVPALQKATRDVVREYDADALVANAGGILTEVQTKISARFAVELERLSGGKFFCGPAFERGNRECPPVELIIKDVDFANPAIQAARDEKQRAAEAGAAKLAEAQGLLQSQLALNKALADPNYRSFLFKQMDVEIAKACASNPQCTLVVPNGANVIVPAGK